MKMMCQTEVVKELESAAETKRQSMLISGVQGCGKTYLAKVYSELLGISNMYRLDPVVSDIRSTIQDCIDLKTDIVICIENLDEGKKSSSYSLLKFIEEPTEHVYIVVTCRNRYRIPDTILSRCYCFECNSPTKDDIENYMIVNHSDKYEFIKKSKLWSCLTTFHDCDVVSNMTKQELNYITSFSKTSFFKDPVSDTSWKLNHCNDSSKQDSNLCYFILKYMMKTTQNNMIKQCCKDCLEELSHSTISSTAVLTKLAFELKYAC